MLRGIKSDIKNVVSTYKGLGLTASFFSFFQGRATTFAIVFTIVGIIGFFKKYDLTSYAAFVAAIFSGVVGHSLKEDYFEDRRAQREHEKSQNPPPAET
jgi:hypothetical protein